MIRRTTFTAGLTLALLAVASPASAAHHTIKDNVLASLDDIERKLVGLAEAMTQEQLEWRPMEGVRSTSEVFMHVAAANYTIGGLLGSPKPQGVDPGGLEKNVTRKTDVADQLKASIVYAREAVEATPEAELTKEIRLFGRESTKQGGMLTLIEHMSEHLGQAIAYARSNKVVPPWSR